MFYSHSLLAKKTPLGMVWIAAHSQKMKKTQIDWVDIQSSADDIMYPRAPIALRLSGHLLVGLVRIYSWKVNYLFQDCNRMLTNIRVAAASIHINLPTNADKAPFESITLPETFNLDASELDESINLIDGPDNHQKDYEQITLAGEASVEQDQYVAFFIDKDNNTNSPVEPETRHDAEPMEEDVLPPFDDDLDVSRALNSASFEGPGSNNHGNDSFQTFDVNNNIQKFQKIEVMRDNNLELENRLELDNTSNDIELNDHSTSVTKRKHSFDPMLEDILVYGEEEPLPSTFHAKSPMSTFDSNIANMEISPGQALPHLEPELQPSPPIRERKRKRMLEPELQHSYDEKIVLANADMKKQLKDTTELIRKRRQLSDLYKLIPKQRKLLDDRFESNIYAVKCSNLQEVLFRSFLLQSNNSSHMEVSSELANELPHVASEDLQKEPEQQNNDKNTEREQQNKLNAVPENSRFDMHTDIQPEQQDELNLIPIPEIPRFDLYTGANINETIQSPSAGVDMTPFNTTTAGSTHDFDKTFDTEILHTVESFTRTEATSYATGASLFSLEEEPLQNSMPRIPSVLLSVEEDFDFLDASTQSSGYKDNEAGTLSARTRAVVQFLKNQSPPQSRDKEHGVLSLNDILQGKTRRRCAQMFFESLVLKTCGLLDVQQEEAYGDIVISPTPTLFATKF